MTYKQFIITKQTIQSIPNGFECINFGSAFIYKDVELELYKSEFEDSKILLLGFIIDPFHPDHSSQEIVDELVKLSTKEDLFYRLESLSGRYVILYKNQKDFLLFHDMFGQRQINYTKYEGQLFVCSSVKLLIDLSHKKVEFIPNHEELFRDKGFQLFDQWFLGDLTWDQNIKKLLPNHFLDLNLEETRRIPFAETETLSEQQVIDYCHQVVKGNFEAVAIRYDKIHQALTSGYDSRTLLSFSQSHWDKIQFYTFSRGDTNSSRDTKIAQKLADVYSFKYQSIKKLPRDLEFEQWYKEQFIIPRTTPKFYNIKYFQQFKDQSCINVTGDGVQMVRNLRSPQQLDSAKKLFDSLGYSYHNHHLESFSEWLAEAKVVADENDVLVSDLFTQEIAQGQLTARWSHEFDLSGCEEFNPFNHKRMVYLILRNIPYDHRITPNYTFQKKLMESALNGITAYPFNPPTWKDKVKKLLKR